MLSSKGRRFLDMSNNMKSGIKNKNTIMNIIISMFTGGWRL